MSDKKTVSKSQQKAVNKYVKNHYDRIELILPKGYKERLKNHAAQYPDSNGSTTINAFIARSVRETMKRENDPLD